jgi:hypothetical protein
MKLESILDQVQPSDCLLIIGLSHLDVLELDTELKIHIAAS